MTNFEETCQSLCFNSGAKQDSQQTLEIQRLFRGMHGLSERIITIVG
jgi:hypothetical protein